MNETRSYEKHAEVEAKQAIGVQNLLCLFHLLNPALVTLVAFKQSPSDAVKKAIRRAGYSFDTLPVNP